MHSRPVADVQRQARVDCDVCRLRRQELRAAAVVRSEDTFEIHKRPQPASAAENNHVSAVRVQN